jgi:WD40 repeat protein
VPDGGFTWLGFSPDAKLVIGLGSAVVFWDAVTGKEVRRAPAPEDRRAAPIALAPDGKTLALGLGDWGRGAPQAAGSAVIWWDLEHGKELRRSGVAHAGRIGALAWNPDATALASAGTDRTVNLWEVSSGKAIWQSPLGQAHDCRLAFSADGTKVVSVEAYFAGRGETRLRVVARETSSGKVLREDEVTDAAAQFQALSPGGALLAWLDSAGEVYWSETATRKVLGRLKGVPGPVRSALFSQDSKRLVTWSGDGAFLIWDLESPALKQ